MEKFVSEEKTQSPQPIVVTDIHMPFWSMVIFLVKLAIAAIPAILILAVLGAVLSGVFAGLLWRSSHRQVPRILPGASNDWRDQHLGNYPTSGRTVLDGVGDPWARLC